MYSPIAVLFSGGLDSMIIAALLHQCIDAECEYSEHMLMLYLCLYVPSILTKTVARC